MIRACAGARRTSAKPNGKPTFTLRNFDELRFDRFVPVVRGLSPAQRRNASEFFLTLRHDLDRWSTPPLAADHGGVMTLSVLVGVTRSEALRRRRYLTPLFGEYGARQSEPLGQRRAIHNPKISNGD
jgi:hypothetical protein